MALVRGNRRSTSKQNSLIDPIEECKDENDHFKNNLGTSHKSFQRNGFYCPSGEYIDNIESVPEENEETIKEKNNFSDGSYISLSDLGGVKEVTENTEEDEYFFEQRRTSANIETDDPLALIKEPSSDVSERVALWKDEMEKIGNEKFELAQF